MKSEDGVKNLRNVILNKKFNSIITVITVMVLLISIPNVLAATKFPLTPEDEPVAKALDWLANSQHGDGAIGSYRVSAWATMSIVASNQDPDSWRRNARSRNVVDFLRLNVKRLTPLARPTDYERNLMAITAAGEDPTNFGGINFVEKVKGFYDGEQIGVKAFLNDDFFGIISLISAGEDPSSEIIQASRLYILSHRNSDGGWSYSIGLSNSDIDDTAAAIMALKAIGNSEDQEVIDSALQFIKSKQNLDGGFPFLGNGESSNTASTSWAINAIVASGQSPISDSWRNSEGNDPVDALVNNLQSLDGSFLCFLPTVEAVAMSTSYAVSSLQGKPYPI